jgi:Lon protease-like protein
MSFSLIPLFPLPLVLFPGQLRQLRIFEPRYRSMLQDCLDNGTPFGLVLSKPPSDQQTEPLPHEIGTLAHISEVERLQDGTFGININGGDRFRIARFQHDKPYLQGVVSTLALLQAETEEAHSLSQRVQELLPRYLDALTQASGIRFGVHAIPPEPERLAYLTAIVLQVSNEEKQALLAVNYLPRLLARETHLLYSELDLMAWISATLADSQKNGFGTDGWLSPN